MLKHSGFTMIELLIALVINLFVMAGLITIFISNVNHYHNSINLNRLNEQLNTIVMMMSGEISRAGYWANAQTDVGSSTNNNPFMASGTDITVNNTNDCILFTYDKGNTGTLPSISSASDDDRYGYRLNGVALQARPWGATFACNAAASNWDNVTDSNVIQITNLTFTLNQSTITTGPGNKGLVQRSVDISITGALTSAPTITKTVTRHVRLMNDKLLSQ